MRTIRADSTRHLRRPGRLAVVLALFAAANGTSPAHADSPRYAQDPNNCNDSNISYWFNPDGTGGAFSAYEKDRLRETFNHLQDPRAENGAKLLTLTESQSSSAEVWVTREILDPALFGQSDCLFGADLILNAIYVAGSNSFPWQVGAHEMFHLAGAEHGGRYNAFEAAAEISLNPTRTSTCVSRSAFYELPNITIDDMAYENWLHGRAKSGRPTSEPRIMFADSGFENWYNLWEVVGAPITFWSGSGAASGSSYITWSPPANSDSYYVQQKMRLHTGNNDQSYKGTVHVRAGQFQ